MTTALAYYFIVLALAMVAMVLIQYLRRTHDLCSLRNVAILGFIIFQLTGAAIRLKSQEYRPFVIQDAAKSGAIFAAWATLFLVLALWAYQRGWIVKWLASNVPAPRAVPADYTMLAMAAVLVTMGLIIRVMSQVIPVLGAVGEYLGTGYLAMSAGLCGWVWAKRFLNPVVIIYSAVIGVVATGAVMYGSFGRRGLIAVAAGLLWGMYYGSLRDQKPTTALTKLGLVGIFPLLFVALYTSVRSAGEHGRTSSQHLQAIAQGGNLSQGLILMFEGQNVANEGFWLIENYPSRFPYRWFFSPRYAVEVLIPRVIYESKPEPLSNLVARQADIPKVNQDRLKMSPGILGSAAAEGGTIAVILYAILAGLFLRFFDQLCFLHPHSPFIVLPVASAMGQVLGFARGETSVMANGFVLSTALCGLTMFAVGMIVESFTGRGAPPGAPEPAEEEADPYEAWSDYGREPEPAAR